LNGDDERFEVVFPRPGWGLVEIVEVENQSTFRTGIAPDIEDMLITAGLDVHTPWRACYRDRIGAASLRTPTATGTTRRLRTGRASQRTEYTLHLVSYVEETLLIVWRIAGIGARRR
jgi:hypothetical protein